MRLLNGLNVRLKKKERWMPPDASWVKVNVDGDSSEQNVEGGIGVLIGDDHGKEGLALAAEWIEKL